MSQLAENAGFVLSYSALSRAEMYSAMEAAFFGDEKTLAALIFDIAFQIAEEIKTQNITKTEVAKHMRRSRSA